MGVIQLLTYEWFRNGTAVQDESRNFFEVEQKSGQDVKDVHKAQAQHQAPPSKEKIKQNSFKFV